MLGHNLQCVLFRGDETPWELLHAALTTPQQILCAKLELPSGTLKNMSPQQIKFF
jgi:hypothetical protein